MFKKIPYSRITNVLLFILVSWVLYHRGPQIWDMFNRQGQIAVSHQVLGLDGATIQLPLPQKHLLIFWATWCEPCKIEMNRINRLVKDKELDPRSIIAISSKEEAGTLKEFVKSQDYQFLVGIDRENILVEGYHIQGTPTLILFNENGVIEWMTMGLSPSLEIRLKNFFSKN